MIKIVGHWELSWNAPIKEVELWNFPLRAYEIKDWYMWPISGVHNNEWQKVNLHERKTFKEILKENSDIKHTYVEPYNAAFPKIKPVSLIGYEHPKDVLYIFGSAHFNPPSHTLRSEDDVVMIPNIENSGVLWPHQCLVALLYDRLVKGWR